MRQSLVVDEDISFHLMMFGGFAKKSDNNLPQGVIYGPHGKFKTSFLSKSYCGLFTTFDAGNQT